MKLGKSASAIAANRRVKSRMSALARIVDAGLSAGFAIKRYLLSGMLAFAAAATSAHAQNCSAYPYQLTNGNSADASQVMGNFNSIQTCANSNLAHNGANSDITSLNGLTTPITKAQGGTGNTTGQPEGPAGGDLGSTYPNPTVVSTHLTSPLPVAQGGTGQTTFSMTGGGEYSIAAATTTDLGTSTSNAIVVTGTTGISSFGSSASTSNPYYLLRFTGNATLVYNATSMQLNTGGTNYETSPGATAIAQYLGSGDWKVTIEPPVQGYYRTGYYTPTPLAAYSEADGLNGVPTKFSVALYLQCVKAQDGYSVGDIVTPTTGVSGGYAGAYNVWLTNTTIGIVFGSIVIELRNPTTGASFNITPADWEAFAILTYN